jgi:O-antigen ligase
LLRSGSLGAWLLAMWVVNLVSWSLSVSLLTTDVFVRESVKILTCFLYALAGFGIGREARGERALVRGLVFFGLPMAAIAIFAFFTRVPSFFIVDSRVVGTLTDPNAFGIYLAMLLPLAASLGTAWAAVPVFLGATIVSFSRTGLAAFGASLLLSMLNLGVRRYLLVLLACLIVGAGVWGVAGRTQVGQRVGNYQESLSQRQGLWALAAEIVAEHPVLGVGSGNWEAAAGRRTEPHNTFLSVMVDNGLVGFAVFMVPLVVWVVRGLRRAQARRWAIAVLVGLVGGIAVSLDNFRPFWLAAGLLAALASVGPRAQYAAASMRARQGAPRERHWGRSRRTEWIEGHATD